MDTPSLAMNHKKNSPETQAQISKGKPCALFRALVTTRALYGTEYSRGTPPHKRLIGPALVIHAANATDYTTIPRSHEGRGEGARRHDSS